MSKKIHVLGGGTVFHVRPHLALSAPAYGRTAEELYELCRSRFDTADVYLHLTKMAGGRSMETNDDVHFVINELINDLDTKVIFMNVAMCDFVGNVTVWEGYNSFQGSESGKGQPRLSSKDVAERYSSRGWPNTAIVLGPAQKVLPKIRKARKDIFLVAFKTTAGFSEDDQFKAGLQLLKEASCNLVVVNDVHTRLNMIVTPEEARYCVTHDREHVLSEVVDMAYHRSHLTFTHSTVVDGQPVPWSDDRVPVSLRAIVNHCIKRGAYKEFNGSTVGHFACKLDDQTFLTSIRKSNFNDIDSKGLVLVKTDGPDTVLAYGAKPSVGGQSQRIVFNDHPGMDCIVHFHCPIKPDSKVPRVSQREYECGSHECGANTSNNLGEFTDGAFAFKAVYLEQHGPNIVFNRNINPQSIISFIEANFDLSGHTGGLV